MNTRNDLINNNYPKQIEFFLIPGKLNFSICKIQKAEAHLPYTENKKIIYSTQLFCVYDHRKTISFINLKNELDKINFILREFIPKVFKKN
jgi:hypothetical protein